MAYVISKVSFPNLQLTTTKKGPTLFYDLLAFLLPNSNFYSCLSLNVYNAPNDDH